MDCHRRRNKEPAGGSAVQMKGEGGWAWKGGHRCGVSLSSEGRAHRMYVLTWGTRKSQETRMAPSLGTESPGEW